MDPYLESPAFWSDFHATFINYWREAIADRLPDHYEARIDERVNLVESVRTLAEELWGEVSHTVNYPHKTHSIACNEQLAALARVASGCTRLVDSIFASESEHKAKSSHISKKSTPRALIFCLQMFELA